ncbi:MAG: sulfatase [Rikenellaceae bacterium]
MRTKLLLPLLGVGAASCTTTPPAIPTQPNIIWLMAEDMGQDLECYGMACVKTPNLNLIASEGVKYNSAVCVNPISSPNRSAMMTGVTQVVTNSHNHRSNRNTPIDEEFKPFTYYLREAGYTCILGNHSVMGKGRKTDCNFQHTPLGEWNGIDKFGLFDKFDEFTAEDQPFFAQIQLIVTHRGDWWNGVTAASDSPINPDEVIMPPFMPDHPQVRKQWASYLDQVEYMDNEVGVLFSELKKKGLLDNTIVFFIGDNGRCDIKGKGYLYEPGLKIPMIAWGKGIKPAEIDGVVSVLDITATILNLAGVDIPAYYEGKPLFDVASGESLSTRDAVYSARDTWDEVVECSRSVTTADFKYIRNYMPDQGWDMHQQYLDFHRPSIHIMRTLNQQGKLTPAQQLFMASTKPDEELYNIKADPFELNNLATDPHYAEQLAQMQQRMDKWQSENRDMGLEDRNNRSPEVMPSTREYLMSERPDMWKYITDGNVIDNYKELLKEEKSFYKNNKK